MANAQRIKFHEVHTVADQGDADSEDDLGRMYAQGLGVAQDDAQAVAWYCKAAERQSEDTDRFSPNARKNLQRMYSSGRGVA